MLKAPDCLHIPPLYEEGEATISWAGIEDAACYELDSSYNMDFDTASQGLRWVDIDQMATWEDIQSRDATWQEIKALPAQGLSWHNIAFENSSWQEIEENCTDWKAFHHLPVRFTIFRGEGDPTRAPDQGLTWGDLESGANDWQSMEDLQWSWHDLEFQTAMGLTWGQHESDGHSWAGFEDTYATWRDFQTVPPRGLAWTSLDGKWKSWGELQEQDLDWRGFEHLPPDTTTHRKTTVDVPLYTKSSMYRLRGMDEDDMAGSYLTTSLRKHLPRSLKNYTPPCIHVPELCEGDFVDITWGELYGAQGYQLERKFSGGYEVIYRGEGVATHQDCEALESIYDADKHYVHTDYMAAGERQVTYRVKAYNTTDESRYYEIGPLEIIPFSLSCLHVPELYEGKDATISWGAAYKAAGYQLQCSFGSGFQTVYDGPGTQAQVNCAAVELTNKHLSYLHQLGYGNKEATYRLVAYKPTFQSRPLVSERVTIIPVFSRDDSRQVTVTSGQRCRLLVFADGIVNEANIVMTLTYDAAALRLETMGKRPGTIDETGNTALPNDVRIVSQGGGKVQVTCQQPMATGQVWSGVVASLDFVALKTATTRITLA